MQVEVFSRVSYKPLVNPSSSARGLENASVCMRVARWGRTALVVARLSSNFSWRAPPFQLTHPIRSRTRRQWLAGRRGSKKESSCRISTGSGYDASEAV